jgi:predicted YcjX-like family ATPase
LVLGTIADTIGRTVETAAGTLSERLLEPTLRLGVTGLAQSGKTVFITSLIANLLDRGRMQGLVAESEGRVLAAFLQPQPDDTVPRFAFEDHLAALTGDTPHWPDSTRAVSQLRLSLRLRPGGLLSGFAPPRVLHLDIVDYPGEWLLDLALLDRGYADWSAAMLQNMPFRPGGAALAARLAAEDATAAFDETRARALAQTYTDGLHAARAAGFSDCSPGRFILPGELAGSPALTFAPLPPLKGAPRGSLWREMERRFDAYKTRVVQPFFRDHFSRIDRQVVLVDALGALAAGPAAVADLGRVLTEVLRAFRPGANPFLRQLFLGRRVDRILIAATRADHVHHSQHARLAAFTDALLRNARDRARFAGAETQAMAIAALRATTETTLTQHTGHADCVRGTPLMEDGTRGQPAAFHPGDLPEDPAAVLRAAVAGGTDWPGGAYQALRFAPAPLALRPGQGPPHIRLDRAAQFLIGDRL